MWFLCTLLFCCFNNQVLTYAQQSKEQTKIEQDRLAKRIQEFRTQSELDRMQASSNISTSTSTFTSNGVGMSSYKNIEAIMQSSANGEVSNTFQNVPYFLYQYHPTLQINLPLQENFLVSKEISGQSMRIINQHY